MKKEIMRVVKKSRELQYKKEFSWLDNDWVPAKVTHYTNRKDK